MTIWLIIFMTFFDTATLGTTEKKEKYEMFLLTTQRSRQVT